MPDDSLQNPFQSPTADGTPRSGTARHARAPVALSLGLGFVGVVFLLLLDGQVFRNTLVFTVCMFISGVLWCRFLVVSPSSESRRLALYVVAIHVALLFALSVSLPQLHRSQKQFNDALEVLHEKHRAKMTQ